MGTLNKLTTMEIRKAQYEGKERAMGDGGGLYLAVRARGKYWRFKYTYGKQQWLYLGAFPEMSLTEARDARDTARAQVRQGVDPSEHRRQVAADRKKDTHSEFKQVALEWFEIAMDGMSANHRSRNKGYILNQMSQLHGLLLGNITAGDCNKVLDAITRRGTHHTAGRVLRLMGEIFEYGHAKEYFRGTLPTVGLKRTLVKEKVNHRAAVITPDALAPLLKMMWNYEATPQVEAALKLQPMLFCRPGELRQLEWTELEAGDRWVIPGAKMKTGRDLIVPLPTQARDILAELRIQTGHRQYAFPSARRPRFPMSDSAVLVAMRTIGIAKDVQTPHGFRATARTILDEVLHIRPEVIEMQLAHAVKDANGRAYNRTAFLDQRVEMMQTWADYLDALRNPKVIPLHGQQSDC